MQAKGSTTKELWDRRLIEGVLSNTDLFRGAAPAQVAAAAARCWSVDAKRLQPIAPRGKRLPGAFAVAYGTVKIAFRHGTAEERVVRLAQAGQTFGESAALLGRAAPFEAVALTECKLVVVPSAAILALIERDPRAARQVVITLAQRNLGLLAELESSSVRGGTQRLAAYLESLAMPGKLGAACVVQLPSTKTLLASRLDMKKETLSRLLRSFAERGFISVARGDITLLDRTGLAELSE